MAEKLDHKNPDRLSKKPKGLRARLSSVFARNSSDEKQALEQQMEQKRAENIINIIGLKIGQITQIGEFYKSHKQFLTPEVRSIIEEFQAIQLSKKKYLLRIKSALTKLTDDPSVTDWKAEVTELKKIEKELGDLHKAFFATITDRPNVYSLYRQVQNTDMQTMTAPRKRALAGPTPDEGEDTVKIERPDFGAACPDEWEDLVDNLVKDRQATTSSTETVAAPIAEERTTESFVDLGEFYPDYIQLEENGTVLTQKNLEVRFDLVSTNGDKHALTLKVSHDLFSLNEKERKVMRDNLFVISVTVTYRIGGITGEFRLRDLIFDQLKNNCCIPKVPGGYDKSEFKQKLPLVMAFVKEYLSANPEKIITEISKIKGRLIAKPVKEILPSFDEITTQLDRCALSPGGAEPKSPSSIFSEDEELKPLITEKPTDKINLEGLSDNSAETTPPEKAIPENGLDYKEFLAVPRKLKIYQTLLRFLAQQLGSNFRPDRATTQVIFNRAVQEMEKLASKHALTPEDIKVLRLLLEIEHSKITIFHLLEEKGSECLDKTNFYTLLQEDQTELAQMVVIIKNQHPEIGSVIIEHLIIEQVNRDFLHGYFSELKNRKRAQDNRRDRDYEDLIALFKKPHDFDHDFEATQSSTLKQVQEIAERKLITCDALKAETPKSRQELVLYFLAQYYFEQKVQTIFFGEQNGFYKSKNKQEQINELTVEIKQFINQFLSNRSELQNQILASISKHNFARLLQDLAYKMILEIQRKIQGSNQPDTTESEIDMDQIDQELADILGLLQKYCLKQRAENPHILINFYKKTSRLFNGFEQKTEKGDFRLTKKLVTEDLEANIKQRLEQISPQRIEKYQKFLQKTVNTNELLDLLAATGKKPVDLIRIDEQFFKTQVGEEKKYLYENILDWFAPPEERAHLRSAYVLRDVLPLISEADFATMNSQTQHFTELNLQNEEALLNNILSLLKNIHDSRARDIDPQGVKEAFFRRLKQENPALSPANFLKGKDIMLTAEDYEKNKQYFSDLLDRSKALNLLMANLMFAKYSSHVILLEKFSEEMPNIQTEDMFDLYRAFKLITAKYPELSLLDLELFLDEYFKTKPKHNSTRLLQRLVHRIISGDTEQDQITETINYEDFDEQLVAEIPLATAVASPAEEITELEAADYPTAVPEAAKKVEIFDRGHDYLVFYLEYSEISGQLKCKIYISRPDHPLGQEGILLTYLVPLGNCEPAEIKEREDARLMKFCDYLCNQDGLVWQPGEESHEKATRRTYKEYAPEEFLRKSVKLGTLEWLKFWGREQDLPEQLLNLRKKEQYSAEEEKKIKTYLKVFSFEALRQYMQDSPHDQDLQNHVAVEYIGAYVRYLVLPILKRLRVSLNEFLQKAAFAPEDYDTLLELAETLNLKELVATLKTDPADSANLQNAARQIREHLTAKDTKH